MGCSLTPHCTAGERVVLTAWSEAGGGCWNRSQEVNAEWALGILCPGCSLWDEPSGSHVGLGRCCAITWPLTALVVPHPVACSSFRGGRKSLTLRHHEGKGPGRRPSTGRMSWNTLYQSCGGPLPCLWGIREIEMYFNKTVFTGIC